MGLVSAALVLIGFFTVLLRAGWSPGADVGSESPLHDGYVTATAMTFAGIATRSGRRWPPHGAGLLLRDVGFATNSAPALGDPLEDPDRRRDHLSAAAPADHTAPLGLSSSALAPLPVHRLGRTSFREAGGGQMSAVAIAK